MSDLIPTDIFSQTLRRMSDNPGAMHARSTVQTADFYGNAESWIVDTFRTGSDETILVQCIRNNERGRPEAVRLVFPAEVTKVMVRQRDQTSAQARRASGHRLIALRKERGDTLGNADALDKARKARKAKKRA